MAIGDGKTTRTENQKKKNLQINISSIMFDDWLLQRFVTSNKFFNVNFLKKKIKIPGKGKRLKVIFFY